MTSTTPTDGSRVHAFNDDALGTLDAIGIARAIANGDLSSTEVLEATLARVDAVNPALNAIVHDTRAEAKTRTSHLPVGVFRGVPTVVKNNTELAGVPTRHGSESTPDTPAKHDEAFTRQLKATGLNVIGTSALPAFGLTASTEFVDREPTRNPWNTAYSSGASSGGSAALVASGALTIAHGNDGGGSIRIPAASCGLVGLKPTRGRVAQAKEARGLPVDIVSNGVLTRTVRDTAWFMADLDRTFPAKKMPPLGLVEGPGQRRLTIGLVTTTLTGDGLDAESLAAVEHTAAVLEGLGHRVIPMDIPLDEQFVDDFTKYWSFLAWSLGTLGRFVLGAGFDGTKFDPFTKGLWDRFPEIKFQLPGVIRRLSKIEKQYRDVFTTRDLVLTPTLGHTTPKLGYLDPAIEFTEVFERLKAYVAYTPLNNVSGGPAISLPLAQTSLGLPLGIHFSADNGQERKLLEVAYELEAAMGFARIHD